MEAGPRDPLRGPSTRLQAFDVHCSRHSGVETTRVLKEPRFFKGVAELIAILQGSTVNLAGRHRMGCIVVIHPGDRGAHGHCDVAWCEREAFYDDVSLHDWTLTLDIVRTALVGIEGLAQTTVASRDDGVAQGRFSALPITAGVIEPFSSRFRTCDRIGIGGRLARVGEARRQGRVGEVFVVVL